MTMTQLEESQERILLLRVSSHNRARFLAFKSATKCERMTQL